MVRLVEELQVTQVLEAVTETRLDPRMVDLMARRETNPLMALLCIGDADRRLLPATSIARKVFLGVDGPRLLQRLLKASKTRVSAVLSWLEVAATHLEIDEAVEFALTASDAVLLQEVLCAIDGPGAVVQSGLRRALNSGPLRQALGIGVLNCLLKIGLPPENANTIIAAQGIYPLRRNWIFAENHAVSDLVKCALHLFDSPHEILALDTLVREITAKAPALLPDPRQISRMSCASDLMRVVRERITRYREPVPVPPIDHPSLSLISSVSALREAGMRFDNCLKKNPTEALDLILGRVVFAIYTSAEPWHEPLLMRVTLQESDKQAVIEEIKAKDNEDPDGDTLSKMMQDLNENTPLTWKLGIGWAKGELGLGGYLWG